MSKRLRDPVHRLVHLANRSRGRYLIGFSGVPGSGKTTRAMQWAQEVARETGPGVFVVLGMDGFHLSRAELRKLPDPDEAFARRGAPWTFNPHAAAQRLRAVRQGFRRESVHWPGFDHGVGDPLEGGVVVPPTVRLVVVEGIYAAYNEGDWREVSAQFDEQWYLDVPWDEAVPRLIARHMAAWGITRVAATARAHENDRINARLVEAGRSRADWLIQPGGAHGQDRPEEAVP